jgi:hypothetical protein
MCYNGDSQGLRGQPSPLSFSSFPSAAWPGSPLAWRIGPFPQAARTQVLKPGAKGAILADETRASGAVQAGPGGHYLDRSLPARTDQRTDQTRKPKGQDAWHKTTRAPRPSALKTSCGAPPTPCASTWTPPSTSTSSSVSSSLSACSPSWMGMIDHRVDRRGRPRRAASSYGAGQRIDLNVGDVPYGPRPRHR